MMADFQDRDILAEESATPESRGKTDGTKNGRKKKKKKRGCGFFILLLLLVAGVAFGMQASGGADLRPFVYGIVPKIPLVGQSFAEMLEIPEIYSLSAVQRRELELKEWEREIAISVRSLDVSQRDVEQKSQDLGRKERDLIYASEQLEARLAALSDDMAQSSTMSITEARKAEIADIVRTFEEMSPKNAAAILERLNSNLAVTILDGLPQDARANLIGRMEAGTAAKLMEQLTEVQRGRNR